MKTCRYTEPQILRQAEDGIHTLMVPKYPQTAEIYEQAALVNGF